MGVLARHRKPSIALEHECALAVHPFESSISVGHGQSDTDLARVLGHWRKQYRGRASHRLVVRGAVHWIVLPNSMTLITHEPRL